MSAPTSRQQQRFIPLRTGTWLPEEDQRLLEAVRRHGCRWVTVATYVGNRTGDQCCKRWTDALNPSIDHSPWSPEEDQVLQEHVKIFGRNWKCIASVCERNRSTLALKNRYSLLQRRQRNFQRDIANTNSVVGSSSSLDHDAELSPSYCDWPHHDILDTSQEGSNKDFSLLGVSSTPDLTFVPPHTLEPQSLSQPSSPSDTIRSDVSSYSTLATHSEIHEGLVTLMVNCPKPKLRELMEAVMGVVDSLVIMKSSGSTS